MVKTMSNPNFHTPLKHFEACRELIPEIPVHASTQMSITSAAGALWLAFWVGQTFNFGAAHVALSFRCFLKHLDMPLTCP